MISISEREYEIVADILRCHAPGCEVRVFGSRRNGAAKNYSDLDLAIIREGGLPEGWLDRLREAFQNSDLRFRVDVLDYYAVTEAFRKTIDAGYDVLNF